MRLKPNQTRQVSHTLEVEINGYTWGGHKARCAYPLKPSERDTFKTLDDFRRIAGDFETLSSATLIAARVETIYTVDTF
jgi:hypothetical protein